MPIFLTIYFFNIFKIFFKNYFIVITLNSNLRIRLNLEILKIANKTVTTLKIKGFFPKDVHNLSEIWNKWIENALLLCKPFKILII